MRPKRPVNSLIVNMPWRQVRVNQHLGTQQAVRVVADVGAERVVELLAADAQQPRRLARQQRQLLIGCSAPPRSCFCRRLVVRHRTVSRHRPISGSTRQTGTRRHGPYNLLRLRLEDSLPRMLTSVVSTQAARSANATTPGACKADIGGGLSNAS